MTFTPTPEQQAIIDAYLARKNLVIGAYAGTGKTSTLRLLASANPRIKVLYIAYNRSAKDDAARSFPVNARCVTSHGLAYRPMIDMAKRIGGGRMTGLQLARVLGILGPARLTADRVLAPGQLASVVRQTIAKFCYSADEKITGWHVPSDIKSLSDPAEIAALRKIVPPIAQKAWDNDITQPEAILGSGSPHHPHGRFPVTHDHYLKAYALTHPHLPGDVIMLDEAQDSNPCVAAMVCEQARYGTQLIMVGDQNQAIYGWRGATDAMRDFSQQSGVTVLSLTQSFRFGPAIAEVGNQWLTILGVTKPLRGWDKIQDRVGEVALGQPDAILCRTNAEVIKQAIGLLDKGLKVAMAGGVGELIALTRAAEDLKAGRPVEHPELMGFTTWGQFQDYVENDPEGQDLKVFADLVDSHGTDGLLAILNRVTSDERKADVIVSTAHKAKGREWRNVVIADDFREPKSRDGSEPKIPRTDAMLAYVAVTRAQYVLDPAGLAWVARFLDALAGDPDDDPDDDPDPEPETAPVPGPATETVAEAGPQGALFDLAAAGHGRQLADLVNELAVMSA